jgi:hypothetical protein
MLGADFLPHWLKADTVNLTEAAMILKPLCRWPVGTWALLDKR